MDEIIARVLPGMTWAKAQEFVDALVLERLSFPEQEARHATAAGRRHVRIGSSEDGVTQLDATLDATDAVVLDAQLTRLAGILDLGGMRGTWDERRAMALGVLATPARALAMLQASLLDELPHDPEQFEECFRVGRPGHVCGTITVDPDQLLPKAQLVVHLSDVTLNEGRGLMRVEKVGPVLAEWAEQMLGHSRVTVRPMIDPDRMAASNAYEVPESMRQVIEWRNPTEVFPWSTRSATRCDMDHTVPFDHGGPPGQTSLGNLGPLGRRVHRAKTHGGWKLEQPYPGIFVWTSPLGHGYLVTPSHTLSLETPHQWCNDESPLETIPA